MLKSQRKPQRVKDPGAILAYGWDWTGDLSDGETVNSSTWTIESNETGSPANPLAKVAGSENITDGGTKTHVALEKGTLGVTYIVKNEVTTTPSAHKHVRRFELRIGKT